MLGRPAGRKMQRTWFSVGPMPRFSTYIEDGMPVAVEGSAPSYHVHVGARVNRETQREPQGDKRKEQRVRPLVLRLQTAVQYSLVRMFSLDKSYIYNLTNFLQESNNIFDARLNKYIHLKM
jgi:hypothetical protein